MDDVTYRPVTSDADLEAWCELMVDGFASSIDGARSYARQYAAGDIWVALERDRVVAGLGLCPAAQRWGGRDVPIDGVAAVTTAPDRRGRGLATGLMRAGLAATRARGRALSALYPASVPLYRKHGYELVGAVSELRARPPFKARTAAPVVEVRVLDRATAYALAEASDVRHARDGNLVERGDFFWARTWSRGGEAKAYGFFDVAAGAEGPCIGGVILHRTPADARHDITLRRYWADGEPGLAAVLAFLDDNGSLCRHVSWTGAPTDRLVLAHAAETWNVERSGPWMLRVVDLVAAFEGRGYARTIEATVALAVVDPFCPWNEGAWSIAVSGGRARVTRGTHAERVVDACGLARIFAGLDDLEGITAGPSPWLDERF